MSYVQLGVHNSYNGNNVKAGMPGNSGDGIDWPYDPNGDTPNFQINWNSNPPPTAQQIEATYEALINWLKDNIGSSAFYNGSIMFLQMTVDIGQHLGSFSPADQAQLKQFLGNQINTGGSQLFLQMILQIAAQATAVASDNGNDGLANATAFLQQIASATSGLQNIPPFDAIYNEAQNELNNDPANPDSIKNWIFGSDAAHLKAHWIKIYDGGSGQYSWVDDEGPNSWDNTINGQQPITSFEQFTQDAQFALGSAIDPDNNTNVDSTIDGYFQTEIQALVAQFKGNPWALLVALMALINQRDENNGASVNSFGGTLNLLKEANGIIQKMLGDISGTTPNTADFYVQLQKLKALVLNNPSLSAVASQLESDIQTVNGQQVSFTSDIKWTISSAGYYNFPPGSTFTVNGKEYTTPPSGVVYISQPGNADMPVAEEQGVTFTFGQLAAMGNTQAIDTQIKIWTNPDSGNNNPWTSSIMSNFENSITGMQTLLNSPSAAIQQEIQNTTQTMQAEENFEKEAFNSITNVNTQVMKLIQSVMG